MCEEIRAENVDGALNGTLTSSHRDGVADVGKADAHTASVRRSDEPRTSDTEIPPKKRKTRRGKSKRQRNLLHHPYQKRAGRGGTQMAKAEAPYNSNRFLIEDHGELESIDAVLTKGSDQPSNSVTRTRDSSFSMGSDGEFYSTPDDEEVFLIKDFDDQYESLQAERLHAMSKDELIKEYMMLEGKVELLSKRLKAKPFGETHKEVQRLTAENESLKRENEALRAKVDSSSESADSETDSSDSCTTSSSSLSVPSREASPNPPLTNGHSEQEQVV